MAAKSPSQGITGSLQDVAVADVLQFVHLGRRTGVLRLTRGEAEASIGFHQGRIIWAQATGAPRIGELLLRQGLLDRRQLEAALAAQRQGGGKRSFGKILVEAGIVTPTQLKALVEEQIRRTVALVLAWEDGEFEFLPDDLRPLDDVSLYPGELIPEAEVDTQAVLAQASQLFAEKNQREHRSPPTPTVPQLLDAEELTRVLAHLEPQATTEDRPEVYVLTPDDGFFARLAPALRGEAARVVRADLDTACGARGPLIVLLDTRQGVLGPAEVLQLRRGSPAARVVALVTADQPVAPLLRAGAALVIPAQLEAVAAAVASLRGEKDLAPPPSDAAAELSLQRLRQAFGELRSGFVAASLALNLLRILSESVARAIMFLVKERELTVLGAFGQGADGKLLAQTTRTLRLSLESAGLLQQAVAKGEVLRGSHSRLPEALRVLLEDAARDEVVVFPVRGIQRVIALVVADNGRRQEQIASWEIVELAAEQAGMAFENELLRRKLAQREASGLGVKGQRSQDRG